MDLLIEMRTAFYCIIPIAILLCGLLIITLITIFVLDKLNVIKKSKKYYITTIITFLVIVLSFFIKQLIITNPTEINSPAVINSISYYYRVKM